MYTDHFRLSQEPFSIAPDPSFLYLSDGHNEALAHLMYGFSHGGFVLITGEVGTGKTTLLRNLIKKTPPDLDVAFILNPRLTVRELLETICDELRVAYDRRNMQSVKQYIDTLNRHLLDTHQQGRSTVVIIDEAQNLSPAVLEQIRLLTNLETNERKLLRIILIGQPELGDMLAKPELRQLAQRITARYHLRSLGKAECFEYVAHRMLKAGGNPNIFSKGAMSALHRASGGIPRLMNVIADRALLGAYSEGQHQVTASVVRHAAKEIRGYRNRPWLKPAIAATAVVALTATTVWAWRSGSLAPLFQQFAPAAEAQPGESPPGESPQTALIPPVVTADTATTPAELATPTPSQKNTQKGTIDRLSPREPTSPGTDRDATTSALTAESSTSPATDLLPRLPRATANSLARPDNQGGYQNQRLAYKTVFALWGADYEGSVASIPCDFAPSAGLQCLSRRGGWSEIEQINLPVVMELWDQKDSPYYAALTAHRAGSTPPEFNVQLNGSVQRVEPRDLKDRWFGTYVVIWRTPPDYIGSLRQGDRHPSVAWLRAQLESLGSAAPATARADVFNLELRESVLRFQRDEGLLADGIVGPLTWIRLADRLGLPAPRLNASS